MTKRNTTMAEIRVPTLGESVTEATIGKWFKHPGDAVAVDEPLVELETDKVTIEVPSPAAGVLAEIAAKDGETVAVGALLGQIQEGAGAAPSKPAPKLETKPEKASSTAADHRPPPQGRPEHRRHAHDLQRGRHECRDAYPQPVQGAVRETERREARLHELLRARLRAGPEGNPVRQCRDRRHRHRLQE